MRKIEGRVAVVTGAASGIGRATALALARAGCDLALVDVDEVGAAETARAVEGLGRVASLHVADVANKDRMHAVPEEVAARHKHVHILVNNAGVGVSGTLENHSLDDYEWIVGINFWGVVHGCKFFIPYLKREEEGHIVNLSSVFGLIGLPGFGAYCATKFAVRGFSESLWAEMRQYNIGVTSVHPGGVNTDIVRNGRVANDDFGDGAKPHGTWRRNSSTRMPSRPSSSPSGFWRPFAMTERACSSRAKPMSSTPPCAWPRASSGSSSRSATHAS
jgi:NAD(P)-dependent dehydrogenase (short-subunit alcohol dehydrogenase family)